MVVETRRVTSRCKVIRVIAGTRVADFDTVVKRNVKENVAGVVQRSETFPLFRDGCVVTLMSLREIVAPVLSGDGLLYRSEGSATFWKHFDLDRMYRIFQKEQKSNFVIIIIIIRAIDERR